jgi:hypothetical protein
MAFKMKGHTLPGINQRINKSSLSDGRAKSSAFQKNTDPVKKEKRTMSLSDEQTLKDNQALENAANREKQGGIGDATLADQTSTEKSRKRQAVIDAQTQTRKDLKKNAEGSKIKKFFTSTRELKSEVTAKALKEAKGKEGQVLKEGSVKDKDKYSGVTE